MSRFQKIAALAALIGCATVGAQSTNAARGSTTTRTDDGCQSPTIEKFSYAANNAGAGQLIFSFSLTFSYTFQYNYDNVTAAFYGYGGTYIQNFYGWDYGSTGFDHPAFARITIRFHTLPMTLPTNPSKYFPPTEYLTLASFSCGYNEDSLVMKPPATPKPAAIMPPACPDYTIIDNRGSGRPKGEISPAGAAFVSTFESLHAGLNVQVISNPYPAAGSWVDMLGAATKIGFLGKYHASVVVGKKWLASQLSKLKNRCRKTPIYLVGYSQGAQAAADVYQSGGAKYVAGMVLFGDPYFNGQDTAVDRVHLYRSPKSEFHPLNGRLGDRSLFSRQKVRLVLSFCHQYDPVCQGLPAYYAKYRLKYHKDYALLGEPQQAANYFFSHS